MRLLLVRHGESEWNRIHRYQGQIDTKLTELGLEQAELLGTRLSSEAIDCIYTSPLQRCSLTAQAIARHHPQAPLIEDRATIEIDHGEWQGLSADEVGTRYSEGLAEWRRFPTRSQMPGGESFSNVLKRCLDFRDQLLAERADQQIVVSTHDVVVKVLVADALGLPMDRLNRIWIGNASISVIDYGSDLPFLAAISESCHLGSKATIPAGQKAL